MRVLWLTNKIIPDVARAMGSNVTLVNEGWISQMFSQLCGDPDIEMSIVCGGSSTNANGQTNGFSWWVIAEDRLSETKYSPRQKDALLAIIQEVKPDLIHIWGSEYPHTLAMALAAKEYGCIERVVISLQGIISFYSYYYYYCGLPDSIINKHTLYELVRKTNLASQQAAYAERGKYEIAALREVKHVIGRTHWDKKCAEAHNPDIHYHVCNETLRKEFYSGSWAYSSCKPHSIFVSQATYPIKGFHLLLEALPDVLKMFPDTCVNVAGADIRGIGSIINKLKCTSYGRYLRKRIIDLGLEQHIHFLGRLTADQMKEQYLKTNVFVSCSSIENSPNSVGEAMILGVPVVSSDVGGVRSVFKAPEDGWTYRWDDTSQLTDEIIDAFSDEKEAACRGKKAQQHARITHNADKNFCELIRIYREICE